MIEVDGLVFAYPGAMEPAVKDLEFSVVNLLCFWLFQIPLAWVLSQTLGIGPWGVHIAVMLGFSSEAVVAGLLFRRGKWKDQKV